MTKIVAVKDNKYIYGSANKIGEIVGCTGRNLIHHINKGKEILAINGFVVYLRELKT